MHINIHDHTTLREIMVTFSDYYPYLQLRFYKSPHGRFESSEESELLDSSLTIDAIKKTHVSAMIEIQPWHKTADVEKEFQYRFGLSVQILVKDKSNWQQTTGMDTFTLKELNEIGRASSDEFIMSEDEE